MTVKELKDKLNFLTSNGYITNSQQVFCAVSSEKGWKLGLVSVGAPSVRVKESEFEHDTQILFGDVD